MGGLEYTAKNRRSLGISFETLAILINAENRQERLSSLARDRDENCERVARTIQIASWLEAENNGFIKIPD